MSGLQKLGRSEQENQAINGTCVPPSLVLSNEAFPWKVLQGASLEAHAEVNAQRNQ